VNITVFIVAPHVGAWIEIYGKFAQDLSGIVAPHVGAWIEIDSSKECSMKQKVAPHVGAWIEIHNLSYDFKIILSRPMWARGLK